MASFESFDGLSLFYQDEGDGRTVVLLHGFAADTNVNYVRSGIFDLLLDEGYRVVTLDARGHGLSSKPTDSAAYADDAMKRDVLALFDHLGLDDVLLVGYSMGAHLVVAVGARRAPREGGGAAGHRRRGSGGERGPERRDALLAVLEADSPDDVDDASLRQFRVMAGLDREPLLAYVEGARAPPTRPASTRSTCPCSSSWAKGTRTRVTLRRWPSSWERRWCGCRATTSPRTPAPSCTARCWSSSAPDEERSVAAIVQGVDR